MREKGSGPHTQPLHCCKASFQTYGNEAEQRGPSPLMLTMLIKKMFLAEYGREHFLVWGKKNFI